MRAWWRVALASGLMLAAQGCDFDAAYDRYCARTGSCGLDAGGKERDASQATDARVGPGPDAALPDLDAETEPPDAAAGLDATPGGLDAAAAGLDAAAAGLDAAAPGRDASSYPACAVDAGVDFEWADSPVPRESSSAYTIGTETVTDNVTGLVWQRAASSQKYAWIYAKKYCDDANDGGVGPGWRLPTRYELLSIVDSTASGPAINVGAFPNSPVPLSDSFWSSSQYAGALDAGLPAFYWQISFTDGACDPKSINQSYEVRCVHAP